MIDKPFEDSFEIALSRIRFYQRWARRAWKPNKYVTMEPESDDSHSYLKMGFTDGRKDTPWTPTRCDLLEYDWYRFDVGEYPKTTET